MSGQTISKAKLDQLREDIQKGLESGAGKRITAQEVLARVRDRKSAKST